LSLAELTKNELLAIAEQFGTDAKSSMKKDDILAALAEDGIDDALVASVNDAAADDVEDDAPVAVVEVEAEVSADEDDDDDAELVLVRMIRANNTYEIRGHHFTAAHPYALVKAEDADYLIEVDGGFRMASPKEAREFYS
jgi:predicted  nucleic acid-binding Zn-ribbon protein